MSRKSKLVEEKELEIVKEAVDSINARKGRKLVHEPDVQAIILAVEHFISEKKLVCYGGTAINNIMPEQYRFYDSDTELPDYDFYSSNAMVHARELADILFKMGFSEVEAKAGAHPGTYKVFVNFMAIADITQMEKTLFSTLRERAYIKNGIHYAPTDFLRMAMYLELSRPDGDVSRWEKVLKRLTLLNKAYPMRKYRCDRIELQRPFKNATTNTNTTNTTNTNNTKMEKKDSRSRRSSSDTASNSKKIYEVTQRVLMNSDVVFIGGFADVLYSRYLPKRERRYLKNNPDFDVLSNSPNDVAELIKMSLTASGIDNVNIELMPGIGEIVSEHYKVAVGNEIIVMIYKPMACHSYNSIKLNNHPIKVASIDTMLMFYLAFSFADREYYDRNRIMCLASLLFYIQNYNRLNQKGLLKRFGRSCYGVQETLESIRKDKAKKYEELKGDRDGLEYQKLFLRYIPMLAEQKKPAALKRSVRTTARNGVVAAMEANVAKTKTKTRSRSNNKSRSKTRKSKSSSSRSRSN